MRSAADGIRVDGRLGRQRLVDAPAGQAGLLHRFHADVADVQQIKRHDRAVARQCPQAGSAGIAAKGQPQLELGGIGL